MPLCRLTVMNQLPLYMVLAIEPMINLGTDDVLTAPGSDWTVITADGKWSAHED